VQNTDTAGIETKGFCHYKCTNGIKRHLLVDTLGNPYFILCSKASLSDNHGLLEIIREHKQFFLELLQEVTILLDNGYQKRYLEEEIEKMEPLLRNKIIIEISKKNHTGTESQIEERESTEARICGDCEAMGSRKNQCVDKSM